MSFLPKFSIIVALAPGQLHSHDFASASEIDLNHMGKIILYQTIGRHIWNVCVIPYMHFNCVDTDPNPRPLATENIIDFRYIPIAFLLHSLLLYSRVAIIDIAMTIEAMLYLCYIKITVIFPSAIKLGSNDHASLKSTDPYIFTHNKCVRFIYFTHIERTYPNIFECVFGGGVGLIFRQCHGLEIATEWCLWRYPDKPLAVWCPIQICYLRYYWRVFKAIWIVYMGEIDRRFNIPKRK